MGAPTVTSFICITSSPRVGGTYGMRIAKSCVEARYNERERMSLLRSYDIFGVVGARFMDTASRFANLPPREGVELRLRAPQIASFF